MSNRSDVSERQFFTIECEISCGFFTNILYDIEQVSSTPSLLSVFMLLGSVKCFFYIT
jgi:hypothetical protein